MFIDLKYHLTSIIAIFLALAIGILVGSSLITGSSVERKITRELEKEFAKLRIENQQQHINIQNLQMMLERHNKFEQNFLPILAKNKLSRYKVAIIQTGDYNSAIKNIETALNDAGADISCVITFNDIFAEQSKKSLDDIIISITGEKEVSNPKDRILRMVANCVVTGSNIHALDILAENGLITISGSYGTKAYRIVLVGGSKYDDSYHADEIDVPLIDKLKKSGAFTIIGTEPAMVDSSYISVYQSQNISTVDNIDEPIGLISLVYLLSGEKGNYGVKKTADKIAPLFMEKESWRREFR